MTPIERHAFNANYRFRSEAARLRATQLEISAKLAGKKFKCGALTGESAYNIAINADMSVSCNCDDTSGDGRIGSLKDRSFKEVFHGPIANELRRSLAEGKVPLSHCAKCKELQQVSAEEAARARDEPVLPTEGLMLENNASCNLSCVGCYRAFRPLEKMKMRIDEVRRIGKELKEMGLKNVSFFTLGEPFMSKNILEEMEVLKEEHPELKIHTSTNGVLLNTDSKREAALRMHTVLFSVDGSDQQSLVKYQVGSNFGAAYQNMCDLVAFRDERDAETLIRWKYVLFRWNDDKYHIERATKLAEEAKVDTLEFWHTKNPIYAVSHRFFTAKHFREFAPIDSRKRRGRAFTDRGRAYLAATA